MIVRADPNGNVIERRLEYFREGWGGNNGKENPRIGSSMVWYEPTRWWLHREGRDAVVWDRLLRPWRLMSIENRIAVIATCISAIAAMISLYALISCAC